MKNQIIPGITIPCRSGLRRQVRGPIEMASAGRRPSRFLAFFALLCAVLLPSPAVAARSATDPAVITALAAEAYLWGLGPEFIERFSLYNTIIGAPFNAFKYGSVPAAWNNEATNAGDASVLYVNGFVNFDESPELVLTVPPSRNQYYVVAYMDAYPNSIGSIGTRTTPSDTTTSYLLVGPKSPYANKTTAKIHGYEYPVMASDTNVNWFLIRVLANTLIDASDPTSVPNIASGVVQKFALNSQQEASCCRRRLQSRLTKLRLTRTRRPTPSLSSVSSATQWRSTRYRTAAPGYPARL